MTPRLLRNLAPAAFVAALLWAVIILALWRMGG
jgi:hypothetical protein